MRLSSNGTKSKACRFRTGVPGGAKFGSNAAPAEPLIDDVAIGGEFFSCPRLYPDRVLPDVGSRSTVTLAALSVHDS